MIFHNIWTVHHEFSASMHAKYGRRKGIWESLAARTSGTLLSFHKSGIKATEKMRMWTILLSLSFFLQRMVSEERKMLNKISILSSRVVRGKATKRRKYKYLEKQLKRMFSSIVLTIKLIYCVCIGWNVLCEMIYVFSFFHSTVRTFGCCRSTRYSQLTRNISWRECNKRGR